MRLMLVRAGLVGTFMYIANPLKLTSLIQQIAVGHHLIAHAARGKMAEVCVCVPSRNAPFAIVQRVYLYRGPASITLSHALISERPRLRAAYTYKPAK